MKTPQRHELMLELEKRFEAGSSFTLKRFYFLRKKYAWLLVISGSRAIKRTVDIVVSLMALALSLPMLLLVAALIKWTDGGPIFYVSTRVGVFGKLFLFPKFRSMVVDADTLKSRLKSHHKKSITFKMQDDPRITWIGRIIRKYSIDELPQLWCVLKGDMSLVGPRPPLPSEVEKYTQHDRRRLHIVPGLTCFWQVQGRGDIPFEGQVQLDKQYIESSSLWTDLRILLQTVPAVIFGKGAY